jgi:hypothetical protein
MNEIQINNNVRTPEQMNETINLNIQGMVYELCLYLEKKVKDATPVGVYGAQGGLLSTIQHSVSRGVSVIKGKVFHQSPYGDVVELGREVGKRMPPPGVLIRWLEVKWGLTTKEAEQIEFVVRRKIAIKGFEGKFMFKNAVGKNQTIIKTIIKKYLDKAVVSVNT